MSGKLIVKQAFGLNPNSKNSIAYSEDHHLAYACGHHICVINTETKEQSFINLNNNEGGQKSGQPNYVSQGITAIACSHPKKIIAIAEKSDPVAVVTFYDSHTLRKKKTLYYPELGSKEIVYINFSDDGRYILTQGGSPEWNLVLWFVEKSPKVIATTKISVSDENPVHQVSFCPWDSTVIIAIGKSVLRLFRHSEGQLRPSSLSVRRDHANFISHCWLGDDKLILGTESGEIVLLENLEYRALVYPVSGSDKDEIRPILSFASISRGFVVGTHDGELMMFERREDSKEQYSLEDSYFLPGESPYKGDVTSLSIGTDDCLICATSNQQLFQISVSGLTHKGSGNFDNLFTSFHGPNIQGDSGIIAIDAAIWKPIVATCGMDKSVRIWNISDKKVELVKQFDEEPKSVTIHPSGLYLVVGFTEQIKIFSLLLDDVSMCHDISVRNCNLVKFSHGGHFIAAGNGTNIQVYDIYTGACVSTMRGHTNKIKSLVWMNNDSRIMSVGAEGAVINWNIFPGNRRPESYEGIIPFSAGAGFGDGSKVIVATAEKKIIEANFKKGIDPTTGLETALREPYEIDLGHGIYTMVVDEHRKMILMGTNEDNMPGSIITAMSVPQLSTMFEWNTIHSSTVTAICISPDGSLIFSGDSHGCLLISEFQGSTIGKGGVSKQREGIVSFNFVDEVVVHKADLEQKKALISELHGKVLELTLNNEHQMRLKEMEHQSKVKDISSKFTAQLDTEQGKYDALLEEKHGVDRLYTSKMSELSEKCALELKNMEIKYKSKVNAESNRHKQLMAETEESHQRWNEENQALVESHQAYLRELAEEYEEKLQNEQATQKALQKEKESLAVTYEGQRGDIEVDADKEIEDMKSKYEVRLKSEEETGLELMAQHALMKKNLQMLSKDADNQKEEIKRLKDKEQRLTDSIFSLEKDIQSHKKEIREREETITDKEKRIFDLKKKNQELEKFRFVLDYKIKELKLQIVPRENEIATMRKQIEEMDLELEQYHRSNSSLNMMIKELKLKIDGLTKELNAQLDRVETNRRLMDKYKRDIKETWECHQDMAQFKNKVVKLYRTYVQEEKSGEGNPEAEDPQLLYNRDREQMERSLDALRRALKTASIASKREVGKMTRESVLLTNELNILRRDARVFSMQRRAIDEAGGVSAKTNIPALMDQLGLVYKKSKPKESKQPKDATSAPPPPPSVPNSRQGRTVALHVTDAQGRQLSAPPTRSKTDNWEAWREIQMQHDQMQSLEEQLQTVCMNLNIDPMQILSNVDEKLQALERELYM